MARKRCSRIAVEKFHPSGEPPWPQLQADGGDVELVNVEGGTVTVRLKGACAGCPMSQITLKQGIEAYLKKTVPGVERVEKA